MHPAEKVTKLTLFLLAISNQISCIQVAGEYEKNVCFVSSQVQNDCYAIIARVCLVCLDFLFIGRGIGIKLHFLLCFCCSRYPAMAVPPDLSGEERAGCRRPLPLHLQGHHRAQTTHRRRLQRYVPN